MVADLAATLGEWASEALVVEANAERERQIMDGQIAAAQGQAFDSLELEGADKWSLEGHRAMTATTAAATLQAAQLQMIEDRGYAMSADEYRDQYGDQLERLTEGVDPGTARMIRERMTEVLPELVGKHTLANANHQEQMVFDSLVQGIGPLALDGSTADALITFMAGGPGSATAALSDARRTEAMVEGIVLAFVEDNARPYGLMQEVGLLDDLSTDQLNRVNDANTQFQNKRRKAYDAETLASMKLLDADIADGTVTEWEAVTRLQSILMQRDIVMNAEEGGSAYDAAEGTSQTAATTTVLRIENALLRRDYDAVASLTGRFIVKIESDGNRDAVGPVVEAGANKGDRAIGDWQVMPLTLKDPGFGIRPSDMTPEDNARVGRQYWAAMVNRYEGDLEAALIGYHAGFGNADRWLLDQREYHTLPQTGASVNHWNKFQAAMKEAKFPTGAHEYNEAQRVLAESKKEVAADEYALMTVQFRKDDAEFMAGTMDEDAWRIRRAEIREGYDVIRTTAQVNADNAMIDQMTAQLERQAAAATTKRQKQESDRKAALFQAATTEAQLIFQTVLNDPASTRDDINTALVTMNQAVTDAAGVAGMVSENPRATSMRVAIKNQWLAAGAALQKRGDEGVLIAKHIQNGSLSRATNSQQARAFDAARTAATQVVSDATLASGLAESEELIAAGDKLYHDQMWDFYRSAGIIDPSFVEKESNELRNLQDENGNARQAAVRTLLRYQNALVTDPGLAESYFDEETMVTADAILSLNANNLSEGIQMYVNQQADQIGQEGLDALTATATNSARILSWSHTLQADANANILQIAFRVDSDASDYLNMTFSEKQRLQHLNTTALLHSVLENELHTQMRLHPKDKIPALLPSATATMRKHTMIAGGSAAVFARSVDWKNRLFRGRENQFDKATLGHDVILAWASDPEVRARYGNIMQDIGTVEDFPMIGRDLLDAVGQAVGLDSQLGEGLQPGDAALSRIRGVREFVIETDPTGQKLFVRFFLPNGQWSDQITVPWEEAGDIYMAKFPAGHSRLTPEFRWNEETGGLETFRP